jgi:hypothetical protein
VIKCLSSDFIVPLTFSWNSIRTVSSDIIARDGPVKCK